MRTSDSVLSYILRRSFTLRIPGTHYTLINKNTVLKFVQFKRKVNKSPYFPVTNNRFCYFFLFCISNRYLIFLKFFCSLIPRSSIDSFNSDLASFRVQRWTKPYCILKCAHDYYILYSFYNVPTRNIFHCKITLKIKYAGAFPFSVNKSILPH